MDTAIDELCVSKSQGTNHAKRRLEQPTVRSPPVFTWRCEDNAGAADASVATFTRPLAIGATAWKNNAPTATHIW